MTTKINPPDMQATPLGGQARILLVEDDPDVRMVMRTELETSGYQIWEAADGPEALKVWKTNASQIDLLLTDIVMPGGLNWLGFGRPIKGGTTRP